MWDPTCGRLGSGREKDAVKIDLGTVAVVGVDCQHLVDDQVFAKSSRKRRWICLNFKWKIIIFLKVWSVLLLHASFRVWKMRGVQRN